MKPAENRTAYNVTRGEDEICHCYDFVREIITGKHAGKFLVLQNTPNLRKGQIVTADVVHGELAFAELLAH